MVAYYENTLEQVRHKRPLFCFMMADLELDVLKQLGFEGKDNTSLVKLAKTKMFR